MNPIRVIDYDPSWPAAFADERAAISAALGDLPACIEHVGSTSVAGLAAKPKIDIDAVIRGEALLPEAVTRTRQHLPDFVFHGDPRGDGMWTFTADRGKHGVRLYLCAAGNRTHSGRVLFRDWLRRHCEDAAFYAALKRRLAAEARGDWNAYTDGKADFVARIVGLAEASGEAEAAAIGFILPASISAR
jgi:GrpB-like predicted nucleotidyltransferase (UPF0157 family)